MKILSVVGARPQLIKAAPVSRALRERHHEVLIHTGQHYDDRMSSRILAELGLPEPDVNLGVGSGSHAQQTAAMMIGIEGLILEHRPDWVLVYGDTNSTIAAALAAAKLHVPVAHVEAGLRSWNRRMPEEVNRVLADHLSTLLFCPTIAAVRNLATEGIVSGVQDVGDVMADTLALMEPIIDRAIPDEASALLGQPYAVATIHRAENTDDRERLASILDGLAGIAMPVVFPLHPRTKKVLTEHALSVPANVIPCPPLGYVEMMATVRRATVVVTDSGGLQKEALWLGTPCVTARDETEWVETVTSGWNVLAGADATAISSAAHAAAARGRVDASLAPRRGASTRIVEALEAFAHPAPPAAGN